MKALILAAGYATRLYPLTKTIPKSLLQVGSKNVLEHILDKINEVKDIDKRAKPFPDEIYAAEKKFKKKVKFMVGDTVQDIQTSKSAKVKSIIIKNGPKQTWKSLKKADFIIKNIKDLPRLIKEVTNGSTT